MASKTCTKCGWTKPLSEYHRDNRTPDKHRSVCNRCRRDEYFRKTHGITLLQRRVMELAQDSKCAICHRERQPLHLDHDHATGRLRELLCVQCNSMLGHAQDNPAILSSAIDYLNKHRS